METANVSVRNEEKMNHQKTTPLAIASLILGILIIFYGQLLLAAAAPAFEEKNNLARENSGSSSITLMDSNTPSPQKIITNSIGMKLIYIPAGEFIMGSPLEEKERRINEGPQHRVKISRGFWIGIYEVTQEQYRAIMDTCPSNFEGDNMPVVYATWNKAEEFCVRLSEKEEKTYRLPTEAEWEYACRAGSTTPFYFDGNDSLYSDKDPLFEEYAWYCAKGGGFSPHPVGQKKPNAFGLYDMIGNVEEWCQDWYDANYYSISPEIDPQGPIHGQERIMRGGSWGTVAFGCRSAFRSWQFAWAAVYHGSGGFRIVLDSDENTQSSVGKGVVEGIKRLLGGNKEQK